MAKKILIVEDERVVAEDIRKSLRNLGYDVPSVASSGEEAIEKAETDRPDLVLMDIVLKGKKDGIEAAEYIRSQFNIPVVFLTAYTDEKTLEKAKITEPYGYLVKPFEDQELHATIEMASYKHRMEKALQLERDKLQALMDGLTRTEIGIDIVGRDYTILFMNQTQKDLFGDVTGSLCYESYRQLTEPCTVCPMVRALERGTVESADVETDGRSYKLISAPFPDFNGYNNKAIEVVMDITEQKRAEMQFKTLFEASKLINSTMDMGGIFNFISDSYQELVGFDNFIIFLFSADKTHLYPAYASEKIWSKIKGVTLTSDEGLLGYCVTTGETLLLGNAQTDRRARKIPGITEPFTSQIVVPLINEGECVGAIHISRVWENAYSDEDVNALKPLSEVISSAVRNSQLYNEIKRFGEELENRIEERSRRIEIILDTRQKLQTEISWDKGLTTISESTSKLGFERSAVFLVNTLRKTLDFHYGRGINQPKRGTSIPLSYTDYFGVQCVTQKRTIHVKDPSLEKGKQISESRSFVWVPVVVQDEAFAALAAGNVCEKPITEEDVKDLEILAGMCAAFIDRTRILVEPVAEKILETELKYWVDPAESYIILEKEAGKSLEIFLDLVTHGVPGFVISRKHPEKFKRKHKLVKTPVLWLSRTERENTLNPDDLHKLNYIVSDFTRKSGESVILLDGLEYLITQLGFDTVLKCVQDLRDLIVVNNSRLIIPFHKETLSPREYSGLEREFQIL